MTYMDDLADKADRIANQPSKEVLILREAVAWELGQLEADIEFEERHPMPNFETLPFLRRRAMRLRTALTSTGVNAG